jgi:RNA polymerase sigma factor (sigma-70 family)
MLAYVAGDTAAFRELFERYAPILQRTLRPALGSAELVKDLVQQTFLQVHRARHDYDSSRPFRPWFFTIALNLRREHFRRRSRRPELPLHEEPEPFVQARGQQQFEARDSLRWALAQLTPEHREVIELHWFQGLSFDEAGACIGITPGAAKLRAHRGYRRLQELLRDIVDTPVLGALKEGGLP